MQLIIYTIATAAVSSASAEQCDEPLLRTGSTPGSVPQAARGFPWQPPLATFRRCCLPLPPPISNEGVFKRLGQLCVSVFVWGGEELQSIFYQSSLSAMSPQAAGFTPV